MDHAVMLLTGALLGTLSGAADGLLFLPYLHIDLDSHANMPPAIVQAPWGQIGRLYPVLAILPILTLPLVFLYHRRLRLHEVLNSGE